MKRRRLLSVLGGALASGCVGESSPQDGSPNCSTPSTSTSALYCLVEGLVVRLSNGTTLAVGQTLLVTADDNTAVILGRDDAGFFARSAICTHACCIVSLCNDAACTSPKTTPISCTGEDIAGGGMALCPCHGSVFRLADGAPLSGPAMTPLPAYHVAFDGADVLVDTANVVDVSVRFT